MSERRGFWSYGRTPLLLTLQKEVVQRMTASVAGDQRCRLSIMAQNWAHVQSKFTIPGSAFAPQPKVNVGVVHMIPREQPMIKLSFKLVEKMCRHLFHYRQKYSIRGVQTLYPADLEKQLAPEVYRTARINPKLNCTKLSIEEIGDMCHVYEEQCYRYPGLFYYDYRGKKTLEECATMNNPFPAPYKFKNSDQLPITMSLAYKASKIR